MIKKRIIKCEFNYQTKQFLFILCCPFCSLIFQVINFCRLAVDNSVVRTKLTKTPFSWMRERDIDELATDHGILTCELHRCNESIIIFVSYANGRK